MEDIHELLDDKKIREELPGSYHGPLRDEFKTIVALTSLACVAYKINKPKMVKKTCTTMSKIIHLINKLEFVMRSEKASRITESDLDLARAHAIHNLPVDGQDKVVANHEILNQSSKIGANLCQNMLASLDFRVAEFWSAHPTAKEQRKRATAIYSILEKTLKSFVKMLEDPIEEQHHYMNNITYADKTSGERARSHRKRHF